MGGPLIRAALSPGGGQRVRRAALRVAPQAGEPDQLRLRATVLPEKRDDLLVGVDRIVPPPAVTPVISNRFFATIFATGRSCS